MVHELKIATIIGTSFFFHSKLKCIEIIFNDPKSIRVHHQLLNLNKIVLSRNLFKNDCFFCLYWIMILHVWCIRTRKMDQFIIGKWFNLFYDNVEDIFNISVCCFFLSFPFNKSANTNLIDLNLKMKRVDSTSK